jgi:long-chain acyl-CoA synthetase
MHKLPVMGDLHEDLINVDTAGTLDGLFIERVRRTPEATAYRYFDKTSESWRDSSWREVAARVARWRAAIVAEGYEPGERAAIQLRNGVDWVCFDQAVLGEGLVSVPLYTEDRPDNVAYILRDSAVRLLLVQNLAQWRKLEHVLAHNEVLRRVLVLDEPDEPERRAAALAADERLRFVADWLPAQGPPLQRREGDPHALASIVYTSGTTGRPKGVMLSHSNRLSNAHAALASMECYQQDLFLSFLPLSHTLERTAGYYLPVMAGSTVAHARSVPQLAEDLLALRPTVMIAVPRIFERVYARISDQLSRQSPVPRALFRAAFPVVSGPGALDPGARASPRTAKAGRGQGDRETRRQPALRHQRRGCAPSQGRANFHCAWTGNSPGLRSDRDQPGHQRQSPRSQRSGERR